MTVLAGEKQAPTLRPYQIAALEAIAAGWRAQQNRLLVKKPTGTGKTVMFAELPRYLERHFELMLPSRNKGARMLVIAHREELLEQAADKIRRANPGAIVAIEQAERHAPRASDVVIASIQTLAARKFHRLKRLLEHHSFRLVIVDEAHHAAAATYRTALVHLGFLPPADASENGENIEAPDFDDVRKMEEALRCWDERASQDRLLVGCTATPNRSDAIGLGCVFQSIVFSYGLKDAINDGWLVPIEPWVVETDVNLDDVRLSRGDFNQKDLAEAVNKERRNQLAVAAWHEHAGGLPTIAFTVDVAHAHALAATFQAAGVRAAAVSGETPREERRQILADFQAKRLEVITNCMVLTEGTDLPLTECILHAKPTKSATLYEQMTGRGLRIHPGKGRCVVIDLVDVAHAHALQASPVLYGLPPGINALGDDLRKIEGEIEGLKEKYPNFDIAGALASGRYTLAQLAAKASTFDVWTVQELGAVGAGLTMRWIKQGEDTYRVQYPWSFGAEEGTEVLAVQKDLLGKFEVVCTFRPKPTGNVYPMPRQRTMAAGVVSAEAALHLAEAYVQQERGTALKLKNREAPWREKPASEKQLALLRKFRVPHNPAQLSQQGGSGRASDLIDLVMARRGR